MRRSSTTKPKRRTKKRKVPTAAATATAVTSGGGGGGGSWQPVVVGLAEPKKQGNHYDKDDDDDDKDNGAGSQQNDRRARNGGTADDELEDDATDPSPGIFFGLEVLTDYTIQDGVFRAAAAPQPAATARLHQQQAVVEDEATITKTKKKKTKQLKPKASLNGKNEDKKKDGPPATSATAETITAARRNGPEAVVVVAEADDDGDGDEPATKRQKKTKTNSKHKNKNHGQKQESASVLVNNKEEEGQDHQAQGSECDATAAAAATMEQQQQEEEEEQRETSALALQDSWCVATGVSLPMVLCRNMTMTNYLAPTPIQRTVLPSAIFGRRNIFGAAPTGSGKTLAFLLPVLYDLITTTTNTTAATTDQEEEEEHQEAPQPRHHLHTLIVTPTRELAKQIYAVAMALTANIVPELSIACLTGGLAKVKQERVLSQHPHIITGTPGRLWEMMTEHRDSFDLTQLRFFILDEADRLVGGGGNNNHHRAFPELQLIFGQLSPQPKKPHHDNNDKIITRRQTFVFSATLTLPGMTNAHDILTLAQAVGETKTIDLSHHQQQQHHAASSTNTTGGGGGGATKQQPPPPDAHTKVQLPAGLTLQSIACIQRHKDSHLYAYLMMSRRPRPNGNGHGANGTTTTTTPQQSSSSTLVFCNSIAGVRRVHLLLQTLHVNAKPLHANMTQRARFQAVEFLVKGGGDAGGGNRHNVVVATDVAARGLDWTNVQTIIHYDAARTMDGFVHRAGRTARGVGDSAVGCSVSLVSSAEDKFYKALTKKTGICLETLNLDSRILAVAQERVNLASKIADATDEDRKRHRDNQWFIDNAAEAGLEIDDDMLDDGEQMDKRKQAKRSGMAVAKQQLRTMLSEPMRVQRYGKFLSTNMSATQSTVPEATPLPPLPKSKKRRKRK